MCWWEIFLKSLSPEGLGESRVFDMDRRVLVETSSMGSEEVPSDVNTWLD